ncbi:MAG: hypothetical protein AAF108_10935 [Planctomycetota bacterium]
MLKFLRKYSKVLLVIFGAFLMVAFLAPQAIQQLGQLSDRKIGTIGGEAVMASDLQRASNELIQLNQITPALTFGVRASEREDDLHWLLLTREAEQGGFYGSDLDGQSFIPEIVDALLGPVVRQQQQFGRQLSEEDLQMLRERALAQIQGAIQQNAQAISAIDRTMKFDGPKDPTKKANLIIAKARGVGRMLSAHSNATRLSNPRLQSEAKRTSDAVTAETLTLNARDFVNAVDLPTDAELAEHFEIFKDTRRGEGDYGIGYRLDRAVKLEWLVVDAPAIREQISIDPIELRTFYEKNRDTYPGDFPGERSRVGDALTQRQLERVLDEIDKTVKDAVLRARRGVTSSGPFFDLPDDWNTRRPNLSQLADTAAERVKQRFEIDIPRPTYERRESAFLTIDELRAIEGLGTSSITVGRSRIGLPAAIFLAREFDANADLAIQRGLTVTNVSVTDAEDRRYYPRIIETRQAQAPQEIDDDVRPLVTADYRALRAFEILSDELETFRSALSIDGSFDAVGGVLPPYEGDGPVPTPGVRFSATNASARSGPITRPAVRESLLDQTRRLDPLVPLDEQPEEDRAIAAASPADLSVVIARVEQLTPLTQELFAFIRGRAAQSVRAAERSEAASREPFGLEALKARHDYVSLQDDDS